MPIYEIVNPSDAYTLMADEERVAVVATLLLGEGWYGLRTEDGKDVLGLIALGGIRYADCWCREHFGSDSMEALLNSVPDEQIAACLESVRIGDFDERRRYDRLIGLVDPAKRDAFHGAWHDEHRSSMNDIGERAARQAAALRKRAAANG